MPAFRRLIFDHDSYEKKRAEKMTPARVAAPDIANTPASLLALGFAAEPVADDPEVPPAVPVGFAPPEGAEPEGAFVGLLSLGAMTVARAA